MQVYETRALPGNWQRDVLAAGGYYLYKRLRPETAALALCTLVALSTHSTLLRSQLDPFPSPPPAHVDIMSAPAAEEIKPAAAPVAVEATPAPAEVPAAVVEPVPAAAEEVKEAAVPVSLLHITLHDDADGRVIRLRTSSRPCVCSDLLSADPAYNCSFAGACRC